MTYDAWPSPDAPPGPLPRIDDLPVAEQGYDQEAVRQAFDSFYRHAAQLDASLRALEAVEAFRRDADALRNDLRALRTLALGGGAQEPAWAPRYETVRPGMPVVVVRLAAEAALIVAVAVIAGVAHFRPVVVVGLMAAVFVIVALSEWLAGRARFVPPAVAFLPVGSGGEPAPYVEAPAPALGVAAEPDEETEPEALTIVASAEDVEAASDAVDPWEREAGEGGLDEGSFEEEEEGAEEEGLESGVAEGEPELAARSGLFRRRRR